jgi:hypothetical protein
MSSTEGCLVIHRFHQEERTVGILRGEFANLCEPLDLVEVQGRYNKGIERFKAQEGQSR